MGCVPLSLYVSVYYPAHNAKADLDMQNKMERREENQIRPIAPVRTYRLYTGCDYVAPLAIPNCWPFPPLLTFSFQHSREITEHERNGLERLPQLRPITKGAMISKLISYSRARFRAAVLCSFLLRYLQGGIAFL